MNEAETRAELIDPKLKEAGWGVVEGSKILRERNCQITAGRIQNGGRRGKPLIADYILVYKGIKLAVVEAKARNLEVGEGVAQAKLYADKLTLDTTYSSNGDEIYQICMQTGEEGLVDRYLSPKELWIKSYPLEASSEITELWRDNFSSVPFEDKSGTWQPRYYQEIAIKKTLEAIAQGKDRVLLTLATGTGKTAIAFQIAWKLFQTRWNLTANNQYQKRRPRILFLAHRNILANQAFNSFSAFPEDALVRVKPKEIKKRGKVPTNGSVFFTIFQSLMANDNTADLDELEEENITDYDKEDAYYNQYPTDYFDLIIIDECHIGGANNESTWRGILEHFSPAVQLGLTATPKRKDNVDTYKYFGDPVYIYSLKEGINDGFLTPFKVKRINTTIDDYIYTDDDTVVEGEIEEGKLYEEKDFNRKIVIPARERYRVHTFMKDANENEKTIIFCATQEHAAMVRDMVNQNKKISKNTNYCVRITAKDGNIGDNALKQFQDNEKIIPTVLTTSRKLSTGVDARNVRNIVLMRPVNDIIEFKQIVGRGTRTFDGKYYFTIYDFVDAHHRFLDPEWDGEPEDPVIPEPRELKPNIDEVDIINNDEEEPIKGHNNKVRVKLKGGKELEIQHTTQTMFWDTGGKPISSEEFLNNLFGELPNLFKSEAELRELWSNPTTRRTLLEKLEVAGYGIEELNALRKLVDAENSDLFDVLEYVFNSEIKPITRAERVAAAEATIFTLMNNKQKEFIEFVLSKYIEIGVGELDQTKLPVLLSSMFQSQADGIEELGGDVTKIRDLFIEFQQYLYKTA
ncbi:DEAD/DEAH box helicase family protein [Aquimarina sp. D1M17]|uniref:EcoAI/FtnUII family type I restriction enzme subunit R n=1 Tax=Aquimarina acroporae TaxID=2937283 RepID=UPI0020C00289|nr:type I restriction endonuclease subunit R [Aquimarina acroporae]MCK8521938.1 DEAD/DEAH box helicase family protein [Aquimarina acroporae]